MLLYRSSVISRVPYVSREEQDKTRRAIADEHRPLGDLLHENFCRLPNEQEIALANINDRKQKQADLKKQKGAKRSSMGENDTTGNNKENDTAHAKKRRNRNQKKINK